MNEEERSLELFNRMVNELRKESDSDFKKKLIELIDIMPITDDDKKKYKMLINR